MNAQTYRTKISPYFSISFGLMIAGSVAYLLVRRELSNVVVIVPILAFLVHLYLSTVYTINGTELHVKSGFLFDETININSITAIAETRSILSAPALSMDRIEIFYNRYDSVVISPPDKTEFIAALKIINPAIDVRSSEKAI